MVNGYSILALGEAAVIIAMAAFLVWRQRVWDARERELLDRIQFPALYVQERLDAAAEPVKLEPEQSEEFDPEAMTFEQFQAESQEAESEGLRIMGVTL